jgi:pyruvate-formate lyase
MANANNPMNGTDRNGITAMLNSLVRLDTHVHAGSVQNLKFSRELFYDHRDVLKGILQTYFKNGGSQAMITVVNKEDLERAMKNPEQYSQLMVRVGGFSARFVTLSKDVQLEIASRTIY